MEYVHLCVDEIFSGTYHASINLLCTMESSMHMNSMNLRLYIPLHWQPMKPMYREKKNCWVHRRWPRTLFLTDISSQKLHACVALEAFQL
jgi:hypothetical protein